MVHSPRTILKFRGANKAFGSKIEEFLWDNGGFTGNKLKIRRFNLLFCQLNNGIRSYPI